MLAPGPSALGWGVSQILGNPDVTPVIPAGECRPSGSEVVLGRQQDGTGWACSGLGDVIL